MTRNNETEILLEIALQVGNTHDLDRLLTGSISTMMRLLNCKGGQVLQAVDAGDGALLDWVPVLSLPRPLAHNQEHAAFVRSVGLPARAAELPAWLRGLPLVREVDGKARMLFGLPGFGVLILEKNGASLDVPFLKSLRPVMDKLGNAAVACVEIAERKRATSELARREQRALLQRSAFTELAFFPFNHAGDQTIFFRRLVELVASTLAVDSVSIWLMQEQGVLLKCASQYDVASGQHSSGAALSITDHPKYFEAIRQRENLFSNDVLTDPRLCELVESYLRPLGIGAMIDAGVFIEGQLVGVVCCEHVGISRAWHSDELSFVPSVAAIVGRNLMNVRRIEAEASLRESEEKLRQITDNMAEVFWLRSADNASILYINPAYEHVWGRSCESLYENPTSFLTSVYDADKQAVMDAFQNYTASGLFNLDYRIVRPDGNIRWVNAQSFPVKNQAGEVVRHTGVAVDITKRMAVEHDLQRHAEIEMLMANISMQFINIKPEDTEGAIQEALGKVGQAVGVDRVYVFEYARDLCSCSNTHEWCAEGVEPEIANLQKIPADVLPWWTQQMRALRNIVIEDVGELPAEAAREREFLSAQGIQSLLVVPLSWGGSLGGFLGFDSVRHKKKWVSDDVAPLELLAGILHNAVKHRAAQLELHELNESLERRVEERKREIEVIQSQLYMNEKLASVGQLAAGVAHEINNPVSFVATNFASLEENLKYLVEVLEAGERLADAVEQDAPDMQVRAEAVRSLAAEYAIDVVVQDLPALFAESRDGIGRITSIVNSMRNFARQDSASHFVPFDLNGGIRDTLVITRNSYKYHALIELELGDIPMVPGVPGQINQVLLNLIVNAAQALAGHSFSNDKKGIIRISTRVVGETVCCAVEDNGPGVCEEHRSRLFDPFFTTKTPGDGTGLGLSISYDIVANKHGGGLVYRPSALGGAGFMMFLPIKGEVQEHE